MFLLLTRVLLWLLISVIVYYVLVQLIPKQYLAWFGSLIVLVFVVLAFLNPNDRLVSTASSFLSFPLKPLGLSLLLLFFGVIQLTKREGKSPAPYQLWAALLILLLSSTPFLAYQIAQQAEREFIQIEKLRQTACQDQCPTDLTSPNAQTAGAIVVLAQETTQANLTYQTQILLNNIGSRLLYAVQVYQEQLNLGNRPLFIVSVGSRLDLRGDNNTQINDIQAWLGKMGVPPDKIVVETRAIDLRTSAVEVEQILKQRRLSNQRIILVSSALNGNRARLAFAQMGLKVIPRATDFYSFQPGTKPNQSLQVQDFLPSVAALSLTTRVIEEYLASIYYFLRGWLSPVLI